MSTVFVNRAILVALLATCAGPTTVALAQEEGRKTVTTMSIAHATGLLEEGEQTASRVFPVDAARDLTFVVLSARRLTVEVVLPDGSVVSSRAPRDELRFFQFALKAPPSLPPLPGMGQGEHTMVVFDQPQFGNYEVRLAAEAPVRQRTLFAITMIPTSELRFGLIVPEREVLRGEAVVIAAALFDGSQAITDASTTAYVVEVAEGDKPLSVPRTIVLRDDGDEADVVSGDGIYTGVLVPESAGRFTVLGQAEGSASAGLRFLRHASGSFEVSERTATIQGPYQFSGVDENGNGLLDSFHVEVPLAIGAEGDYNLTLTLTLRAGNGRAISSNRMGRLAIGTQKLGLDFTAADVRSLEVNGPIEIAARLDELAPDRRILRDRLPQEGLARELLMESFER